ncbi:MAG TPA: hypothetical protein DCQ64_28040 [Candidatus Rokubacteria bacterium]|nr:hypothetical protein [Candidatus Rokubacteria bacterium]
MGKLLMVLVVLAVGCAPQVRWTHSQGWGQAEFDVDYAVCTRVASRPGIVVTQAVRPGVYVGVPLEDVDERVRWGCLQARGWRPVQ